MAPGVVSPPLFPNTVRKLLGRAARATQGSAYGNFRRALRQDLAQAFISALMGLPKSIYAGALQQLTAVIANAGRDRVDLPVALRARLPVGPPSPPLALARVSPLRLSTSRLENGRKVPVSFECLVRPGRVLAAVVLAFPLLAVAPILATADAATFSVTKTADSADGSCGADCSLREAMMAANADADGDTVTVPAGRYDLTLSDGPDAGGDTPAIGDLDIRAAVAIRGAGAPSTVVAGAYGAEDGLGVRHLNARGNVLRREHLGSDGDGRC